MKFFDITAAKYRLIKIIGSQNRGDNKTKAMHNGSTNTLAYSNGILNRIHTANMNMNIKIKVASQPPVKFSVPATNIWPILLLTFRIV